MDGCSHIRFDLFIFHILAFNGITLSMTSGMACYLYRRCKCVAYGIELYFNAYDSYGLPTGNHVSTCGPKPPYNFKLFFFI